MPTVHEEYEAYIKKQEEEEAQRLEMEEELEEQQKNQVSSSTIFECQKCGYIIDETEKRKIAGYNKPIPTKCPKCGGKLKPITKEQMVKAQRKEVQAKRKEIVTAKRVVDYVKNETLKLLNELRDDLLEKRISPNRFIALFMKLSYNIARSRSREYEPDWMDYKKLMIYMCQNVMDTYDVKIDAEKAYEDFDFSELDDDPLCSAYIETYTYDIDGNHNQMADKEDINQPNYDEKANNFAILQERLTQKRDNEIERETLEKERLRLQNMAEKGENKRQNTLEKDFKKTLGNGVNKI